jgi:hypothetical protein
LAKHDVILFFDGAIDDSRGRDGGSITKRGIGMAMGGWEVLRVVMTSSSENDLMG